jgi:hypothetical protein
MTATLLILIGAFVGLSFAFYRALLPDKKCAHDLRAVGPNRWRCVVCKREVK